MFKNDINYPKISVVVPFYNSSETIDETLCSVEAQTYPSVEIIVVNDGSNEYHSNKLKQILSNRPHVQLVEQSNKGPASARNLGARQASGVYFCFLDSDDVIKPQYLSGCTEVLKDSKIKLVYTKAEFFGAREGDWSLPPYEGLKSILLGNRIPSVALQRSKDFFELGGFDESFRTHEDWDYWIRLLQNEGDVVCIQDVLFRYRKRSDGTSLIDQLEREPRRIQEDWQKIYDKYRSLYLQHNLGYHDLIIQLNKTQQSERMLSSHLKDVSDSKSLIENQFEQLDQRYRKYKKLWTVRLMKPIIKTEQAISSANTLRKGFRRLVKEKGSIGKAYQHVRRLKKLQGYSAVKQLLRSPRALLVGAPSYPMVDTARLIFDEQQQEYTQTELQHLIGLFTQYPKISVLMPVYKTPVKWLARVIESLQEQVYENWELCAVDDCSPTDEQRKVLQKYAADDSRVRYHFSDVNQGISAASNIALDMATGEYITLIDHDDEITPDAFYWIAKTINDNPDVDFMYTDECKIDDTHNKKLFHYIFKPNWSPEILLNGMLTGHLTTYKKQLVYQVGGFRSEYDFSQDYDLALRISERAKKVIHIERILYLWRAIPGSAASGGKDYARSTNIAALQDYLDRNDINATAHALSHANYAEVAVPPETKISIVIPSDSYDNLKLAIQSVLDKTDYPYYEIVAVCNTPLADRLRKEFFDTSKVIFSGYDKKYNFPDKCNQGAKDSSGEIVVFYNDDVFPIEANWLSKLIEYLYIPGVEATSPKLLHKNETIQYAGMISGTPGVCGTAYNGVPCEADDDFLSMHKYVRNVSILSGACCALRKKIFFEIGGFDAVNTPDGHSDVDLSYKLIEAGYRCVYTPYSVLFHIGNHSWGTKKEKYKADIFCLKRWGKYLSSDNYFTDSMKRVLYKDFQFKYKIFASQVDPSVTYTGQDVLFISHELTLTGAPRMLYYAAQAVKARGGFPVVVAPEDGPLRTEFEKAGITVIIDASIALNHFLFKGFARNFDVVVVNTIAQSQVVEQLSEIEGLKIIWWLHESKALKGFFDKNNGKKFNDVHLICVSDYARSFIPTSYHTHVLHNGIPDVSIDSQVRQNYKFTFVLCGTIEPRKGQDIFVEAISILPKEVRASCQFLIAGTLWEHFRPFWDIVEEKLNTINEVKYLGSLTHADILAVLSASDVVVCCSRDESFSLTVAEAAMLGKVGILNTNVGVSSIFKPLESGLFFEVENAESLANQFLYAFENQERIKKMGLEARRIYEQELTIEKFSDRFFEIVEHI